VRLWMMSSKMRSRGRALRSEHWFSTKMMGSECLNYALGLVLRLCLNFLKRDVAENEEAQVAGNILENASSIAIVVAFESSLELKSYLIAFAIIFHGLSH
jgi:hypothetical protein